MRADFHFKIKIENQESSGRRERRESKAYFAAMARAYEKVCERLAAKYNAAIVVRSRPEKKCRGFGAAAKWDGNPYGGIAEI
ncbi:MAG: hypothetical protein GY802_09675 [Gammaproteobacteria bacterium]|nr:hypothetical protein [Gammaproteobacteria bacterium]